MDTATPDRAGRRPNARVPRVPVADDHHQGDVHVTEPARSPFNTAPPVAAATSASEERS